MSEPTATRIAEALERIASRLLFIMLASALGLGLALRVILPIHT